MFRNCLFTLIIVVFDATGCGQYTRLQVNKDSELFKIREVKGVPETHPAMVLFVNRSSGVWQKCLIFEGSFSQDQLFGVDQISGQYGIKVVPVGYFEVGAALDGNPRLDKTKLVGPFVDRHDYTVLCFMEGFDGRIVSVQTTSVNYTVRPLQEKYYYYTALGQAEKFVNYYHYLPGYYRYSGSSPASIQINLNELLQRFIHTIAGHANGPKVEDNTGTDIGEYSPKVLHPAFPKLSQPDSTL